MASEATPSPVSRKRFPRKRLIAAASLAAVLLLAAGAVYQRTEATRKFFDPRVLLSRFPAEDALAMSVDVAALRAAGLLADSKMTLEPEYKQFVESSGFDYRRDLDSVTASFSPSGSYFIARGRFDWPKLRDYAVLAGGACYRDLCRVQGSRPERHISFLPLRPDALALAVSGNDLAATLLTKTGQPVTAAVPSAPVWISAPGSELRRERGLPPEMRLVLSALTTADRIVVTLGPAPRSGETGSAGAGTGTANIEARMEAVCRTPDDAKILASQLRNATALLKEALARDGGASTDEVALLLVSGSFDRQERRVTGTWPVRKSLLEALAAGI